MTTLAAPPDAPRGMFSSLRVRNYRFFAAGQVVSLAGTWMQRIAQDWLVLDLSGGSPIALGFAAALQFAPTLGLSLWGGVLADRFDKRRLLLAIQAGMGLCALVLGLLDVSGLVTIGQVYVLCFALGCCSALDVPVRQSFVSEMVGSAQVGNAVALNSLTFNTARIVGPSVAGLMIAAVGTGWVFLVNAASFAGVIVGLLAMDAARLYVADRVPRRPGQLREGLRYVRARPDLVALLSLVFLVSTFGINFYVTLPLLARNVFQRGAEAYGLLTTLIAVGSVVGAMWAARRVGRPRLRVVLAAALAFGILQAVAGLMPTFALTGVALVPVGVAALLFTTAVNSAVQLGVDASFRGRVMGLYMLLFLGGTPLGAPLLGLLAERFGGRAPTVAGGVVTLVAVLGVGAVLVWRRRAVRRVAADHPGGGLAP